MKDENHWVQLMFSYLTDIKGELYGLKNEINIINNNIDTLNNNIDIFNNNIDIFNNKIDNIKIVMQYLDKIYAEIADIKNK